MPANDAVKRIVVGIDGSEHADEALEWAIKFARPMNAEIIAVFAIAPPSYFVYGSYAMAAPQLDPEWQAEMRREFEQEWCKPLRDSGLAYRALVEDGRPASVIATVAEREDADLVVVGRRGRGGFVELLLGSVSHDLSHHCKRPVLLISHRPTAKVKQPATAAAAEV